MKISKQLSNSTGRTSFDTASWRVFGTLCLVGGLFCLAIQPVLAQEKPKDSAPAVAEGEAAPTGSTTKTTKEAGKDKQAKEKEETVKTGIIANTGKFGFGPQSVDVDSGGSTPGEESSVVTGSVSEIGGGKCEVTVTNSSKENAYSVRYQVIGENSRGSKVVSKSFSDSLKPGKDAKHDFSCAPGLNLSVKLTSANKRK